LLLQRK